MAAKHFGIDPPRPTLRRDEVVPFLVAELARAPELWIQKGYLARAVCFDSDGIYDDGIVPLAHFVDASGPDAVAAAVEVDADGKIVPVLYVRRAGRLDDRLRARRWVGRLEDSRADEDAVRAELHAEGRIGRSRDAAGRKGDDRQPPVLGHPLNELDRGLQVLGL